VSTRDRSRLSFSLIRGGIDAEERRSCRPPNNHLKLFRITFAKQTTTGAFAFRCGEPAKSLTVEQFKQFTHRYFGAIQWHSRPMGGFSD
jgi:hypothetical protein